jgi:hypothetical protein
MGVDLVGTAGHVAAVGEETRGYRAPAIDCREIRWSLSCDFYQIPMQVFPHRRVCLSLGEFDLPVLQEFDGRSPVFFGCYDSAGAPAFYFLNEASHVEVCFDRNVLVRRAFRFL